MMWGDRGLGLRASSCIIVLSTLVVAGALRYLRSRATKPRLVSPAQHHLVGRKITHDYDVDEYDVIIVGGGTAGCVLASRLTEDPSIRVLLLEAGGSGVAVQLSRMPAGYPSLFRGEHLHNLFTNPDPAINNRRVYWPRGKMLGGCSSMNAMICHWGAPQDYDEWAKMQKGAPRANEWAFKDFRKYFSKFERYNPDKRYRDIDIQEHGGITGKYDVGHECYSSSITKKFIQACERVGLPRLSDTNTFKGTLGVSKLMTCIVKGERVSAESAYLTADVLARPNLVVATHATVTKLVFDTSGDQPRAIGAEFASSRDGPRFTAKARKEVIVAAGAIHTPHILMLSGIGPEDELHRHGIPVVVGLGGVGSHLRDHPSVLVTFREKSGGSLNYMRPANFIQTLKLWKAIGQYMLFRNGPMLTNLAEAGAFFRLDDPKLFPTQKNVLQDSPSSSGPPDIEIVSAPMGFKSHGGAELPRVDMMSLIVILLRPTSAGTISLQSTDPFDPPIIAPNYLETQHDIDALVHAIRATMRIANTPPYSDIINSAGKQQPEYFGDYLAEATDAEIVEYIRARLGTLFHPACTARMAPLDEGGVVDTELRVHGTHGLRIVDASVFPEIPSGHTAGPTLAVAEKAADMIKASLSTV